MSRDLIIRSSNRAQFLQWAERNNLIIRDEDNNRVVRNGFSVSPWNGTGRIMRTPGDFSDPDNPVEPTFVAGYFVLLRIGPNRRSAYLSLRNTVRTEGTTGTAGGIRYFEWDGVQLYRANDVESKLAEWGVPGHEYLGGNSYAGYDQGDEPEDEPAQ